MDNYFFRTSGNKKLFDLLSIVGVSNSDLKDIDIISTACLKVAKYNNISFLDKSYLHGDCENSKAGVIITKPYLSKYIPKTAQSIIVDNPREIYVRMKRIFYLEQESNGIISDMSLIDSTVKLGKNVQIDPFVHIKKDVIIGDNTIVKSHVIIEDGVKIGSNCCIESSCVVKCAIINDFVFIDSNTTIGSPGFGIHLNKSGNIDIPQIGIIKIGNNVRIGSSCVMDRGAETETIIGDNCRIDHSVHIAHNVVMGEGCVLASQVGISGSCNIGKGVIMGGQVGIADGSNIGNYAIIMAKSGVNGNIPEGKKYAGIIAIPHMEWLRMQSRKKKK